MPIVAPNNAIPVFPAPQGGEIDDAMLAAFRDAGVMLLQDFVPVAHCESLRARANALVEAFDPASVRSVFSTTSNEQHDDRYFTESGDKIRYFFEEGAFDDDGVLRQPKINSLNKMGHAMHDLDPVFDRFSRTAELATLTERLGFAEPLLLQSMYIFKPPGIGGEVVCHQDSAYLYTEPESCIGFWFALEDATIDNGCMRFIPGAHKGPLKSRNRRHADGRLSLDIIDESPFEGEALPVEARAGSLVVFDGRAPHMSAANRSARSRHAYTVHIIDGRCHYPADNWLQRDANLPLRGFD